jgi:hypothetical protein
MSTKFEQLLDYIVNEEMDKANELFHEIVVEKSRNIYENLIAQEAAEDDEEVEESADEDMDESADEDMDESEEQEESVDEAEEELEDSYMMDADEPEVGGDEETDDLGGDVGMDDEMGADMGPEASEDDAMMDIKNAIEELEAAFAELEASQGGDMGGDEFGGDEFGGEEPGSEEDDLKMGMFETKKRMTREYVEKVGNDWEKNSMKGQKQHVAAGTGDTEGAPDEGRSPIAKAANKPGPAGVNGKNLVQGATEGQSNTGTSPGKVQKGLAPHSGEKLAAGMHNVDGKKSGVKTLSNVKGGHGAEKKGGSPGPVGAGGAGGPGDQTSVNPVKQFLKPYSK